MSYKVGEKVPYKGIYRCRKCGEAKEYEKGEKFCDCPNDKEVESIIWTLVDKE